MKEILTKSFWQGVKKTFHEALEEPPAADSALQTSAAGEPVSSPTVPLFSPTGQHAAARQEEYKQSPAHSNSPHPQK
jgi:hypothetical protein